MKKNVKVWLTVMVLLCAITIASAEPYKVANTGITIEVLPGWTVDSSGQGGTLFILKDKPLQGFSAMLNLVTEDLYGKSADAWLTEYKTGLAQAVKELHIIKQGPIKLNDVEYLAIEFRGFQGKVMLHWLQVIHIQEGKAWIFTGTTLERYSDIYIPKFQKMLSTIYFPPPPPEDFSARGAGPTSIQLSWKDVLGNEVGYIIQRRDGSGGSWQNIATVQPNSTSYLDQNLTCGTEYFYRIKSLNPRGDSNWSGEVAGTTEACPQEPAGMPDAPPPPATND